MSRRLLLVPAFLLALCAGAQRIVPVGVGSQGSVFDMVAWNNQLVVAGMNSMDLMDSSGGPLQSWDGNQVYTFPDVFDNNLPGFRLETINGELFAGGRIEAMGHVVRWDGSSWLPMDQGFPALDRVSAMCVHENQLICGTLYGLVCRWNGATWDSLGSRFNENVEDLVSHGGVLYAGGRFTADEDGNLMGRLAQWNGSAWAQTGSGLDNRVIDLASTPDGLILAGYFDADGNGAPLPSWAIWNGSAFGVPALSPMPRPFYSSPFEQNIVILPDGSFIVGQYLVRGMESFDIGYAASCAAEFNGTWFVGGTSGGPYPGHTSRNGFSEFIQQGLQHVQVDAGAMSAMITPTPALFENHWRDVQGLEVPKGEGVHAVYSASPWMRAKQNGLWKNHFPRHNDASYDSLGWAGPQQATARDHAFYRRYHQVWLLDQFTIDQHAAHWNDSGYEVPYPIASWPGNGNTANGEPERLAPFKDQDNDGLYEPEQGDYPLIRGDRAAYTILHGEEPTGYWSSIACDIHVMVYNYAEPSLEDRYNSTFVNLSMINRSGADYDSVRFGLFTDPDVGGFGDDLAGCDSLRNLWFAYNGDEFDADTTQMQNIVAGYGAQPPAIGFKFLNQVMSAHSAWPAGDDANTGPEMIDALNGTVDGLPHSGPGFNSNFEFPGGAWTDQYIPGDSVGDRRNIGSHGPFTWPANDTICFDLAVIYARATSGGAYASVDALKQRADAVQAWYDEQQFVCSAIEDVVAVDENALPAFSAYPNPVTDRLTLNGPAPEATTDILVMDATGKIVLRGTWPKGRTTVGLDLSRMENGAYLIELRSAEGRQCSRVVKMR